MGVIDHGGVAALRLECLEAASHRHKHAKLHQHIFGIPSERNACAIHGGKVVGIKSSGELHLHVAAVDVERRVVESAFHEKAFEVGKCAQRVGKHLGLGVLHHGHALLVVDICDGESVGRQHVEKCLFGVDIVIHSLVEIEVVACEVGEDAAGKMQTIDAVLHARVRAYLHKCVFATFLHHVVEQFLERKRVGGGLLGVGGGAMHYVLHRGDKSSLKSHHLSHLIEQSGGRCLTVGASDSHQVQVLRRVVEPLVGYQWQGESGVLHHHIGSGVVELAWKCFAHYGSSASRHHVGDEFMGIDGHSVDCHKQRSSFSLSAIANYVFDGHIAIAHHLQWLQTLYYFVQRLFHIAVE